MKSAFLLLIILTSIGLTACGRVSKPEAPKKSFYPHTYIVKDSTVQNEPTQSQTQKEETK